MRRFPFTRNGAVPATVRSVSADAVLYEKRGAVFKALLVLERPDILVNGKAVMLRPGMSLAAEVKTGRRRVLDYLLCPVRRVVDESLKERWVATRNSDHDRSNSSCTFEID